jgi:hypothetical protein
MRHDLTPSPILPGSRGMSKAPTAGLLVAAARFAHVVSSCDGGAVAAVSVAAITPAANEDLHPATSAQVQTASSL